MTHLRGFGWAVLPALLAAFQSWACSVPVFRYALERWETDPYSLLIFHRGELNAEQTELVAALRKWAEQRPVTANVVLETCDLAGKLAPERQAIWDSQTDAQLPWMVVLYPGWGEPIVAWAGPLNAANALALVDSPARRQIATRLLKGDSVVWLLLECGRRQEDRKIAAWLKPELDRLQGTLELPEQPAPDDFAPPSSRLNSDLPLRLAFSTLAVSRSDPAERIFVEMLLRTEPELRGHDGPIVFVLFGKARVLGALYGKILNETYLTDAATFLIGECQCMVKEQNPGLDLLLAADWDALLDGRRVEDPPPPALLGLSAAAQAAAGLAPGAAPGTAPAATGAQGPAGSPPVRSVVLRNVVLAAGGLVILAAALTLILRSRARKAG
jgi:hypothetical protein